MDKSALITGAGSGLGRGLALALARRGYHLSLVGRDQARLQTVAREVEPLSRCDIFCVDLSDTSARSRFIENVLAGSGAPNLLIHNAALMSCGDFLRIPAADLEATLAINLFAPAELTQRFCAASPRPEGVIFVLSTAARFPQPYNSLYSSSKAGLRFLAESLQVEFSGQSRVCLVYPPLMNTALIAGFKSPLPKADPLRVAEKIIRSYENGRDEITWFDWEIFPVLFYRFFPRLFRHLLKSQRRLLAKTFDAR